MQTKINLHLKNNDHARIMRKIQFVSSFNNDQQLLNYILFRTMFYCCPDFLEYHSKVCNLC